MNAAAVEEFTRSQVIATQARILTDAIEAKEVTTAPEARDQAEVVLEEIDHELEAYDPPAQMAAALMRFASPSFGTWPNKPTACSSAQPTPPRPCCRRC